MLRPTPADPLPCMSGVWVFTFIPAPFSEPRLRSEGHPRGVGTSTMHTPGRGGKDRCFTAAHAHPFFLLPLGRLRRVGTIRENLVNPGCCDERRKPVWRVFPHSFGQWCWRVASVFSHAPTSPADHFLASSSRRFTGALSSVGGTLEERWFLAVCQRYLQG